MFYFEFKYVNRLSVLGLRIQNDKYNKNNKYNSINNNYFFVNNLCKYGGALSICAPVQEIMRTSINQALFCRR